MYRIYTDMGLSRRKRDHILTDAHGNILSRSYDIGRLLDYIWGNRATRVLLYAQGRVYACELRATTTIKEPH